MPSQKLFTLSQLLRVACACLLWPVNYSMPTGAKPTLNEKCQLDALAMLENIRTAANNTALLSAINMNLQPELNTFTTHTSTLCTPTGSSCSGDTPEWNKAAEETTYTKRMTLVKKLKSLEVRAITINRAIGHMRSPTTPVPPPPTEERTSPTTVNRGVAVKCHADSMEVVVQADLFDVGLLLEAAHLHLGSKDTHCTALPSAEAELTIHVHLLDCGTQLTSTEETLVYSNVLFYSPEPSPDGLLRLEGVTVPVECRYKKRYSVEGGLAVQPNWIPFASAATAEDHLEFKLTLMTDDWQLERQSSTYFLGDPIHVEASIIMHDHMPLRIYVDHCVATVTPDADAALRYDFVERHGCLMDTFLTDSGSRYLPRVQENKLRFQLDAFRFYQEPTNLMYISCQLKAVAATLAVSSQNRACSFIHNRWQSVDGYDQACASCDVRQQFLTETAVQKPPPTIPPSAVPWRNMEPLARPSGPLQTQAKQAPANYFNFRSPGHLAPPSSSGLKKRGSNSGADGEWTKTTSFGPLVILPSAVPTKQADPAASLRPTTAPQQQQPVEAECGPDICSDDQICCTPGNSTVTCCKPIVDPTYYNIAMITRKLSGILILLLLFTMGYSIQRLICSKTRRRLHDMDDLPSETPTNGHPTTTVSREPLVMRQGPGTSEADTALPVPALLPTYEECTSKHLPTYEESLLDTTTQHTR
ncbi:hypothetical protein NHX12_004171 [Muraenolepis orangiensis]|uniref:Zona pellucida sperm-binding protein 3 n=1 Tax=Muraenolepis orangiensis TaxID=630683 RepID=A0A9Q0IFA6_9TELE|nr:hypothetical protein NHX12_004171 [Muraenolepis orangiensis]